MTPSGPPAADDAVQLRTYLADRDSPCPACGYSLRGLTSQVCPECQRELRLGIELVEPRLAAFLFGAVGFSIGFGFAAPLLTYYIYRSLNSASFRPAGGLVLGTSAGVLGLLLYLWLSRRRWVRRKTQAAQWLMGLGAWVLSGASVIWFFDHVG